MTFYPATFNENPIDRFRGKCAEFAASLGGKFGVRFQHLDSESYLVDDALARSVAAGEQFEVFESVVGADAVDVMYGLIGAKFATEVLFHDVAVLENGDRAFPLFFTHVESHVPGAGREGHGNSISVSIKHLFPVEFSSAFFATNFTAKVKVLAVRASVDSGHRSVAVFADSTFFDELFSGQPLIEPRAVSTAIQRIFTPLFSVGSKVARLKNELLAAFGAGECSTFHFSFRTSVFSEIFAVASLTAKLVRFASSACELLRAVIAGKYQGHVPLLSTQGWYHNTQRNAIANFGAA